MGTSAAMLVPYFKPREGCDYDNKPIDVPFQSRNVIQFHLPLLLGLFALKKSFYIIYLYLHLVSEISFSCDCY